MEIDETVYFEVTHWLSITLLASRFSYTKLIRLSLRVKGNEYDFHSQYSIASAVFDASAILERNFILPDMVSDADEPIN